MTGVCVPKQRVGAHIIVLIRARKPIYKTISCIGQVRVRCPPLVVRTVTRPPSIVVQCGGVALCVVICGGVLVVSCRVLCVVLVVCLCV